MHPATVVDHGGGAARWLARPLSVLVMVATIVVGACAAEPAPTPGPSATAGQAGVTHPSASASGRPSPGTSVAPSGSPTAGADASPGPTPSARIAGATQTPCPGSAGSGARGRVTAGSSRNWAGYIVGVSRTHVTCVEGTWTQPKVLCSSSSQASMAIWVGIDGVSSVGSLPNTSATLAQTGTVADCSSGKPQLAAWYEFLPDLKHVVPFHVPVATGDKIWAQVRWLGSGKFNATLINLTQLVGASQVWVLKSAKRLTAEWIVEAPASQCSGTSCTILPLARFTTVVIDGAATIGGSRYTVDRVPYVYLRTTISRASRVLAVPSSLSSSGFSVRWKAS